ncbi:MAG: membrane dipeptidase [Atopobiaceae bacterium]|nr:membrane dipeptidase [Atopobiaceae bacterium]
MKRAGLTRREFTCAMGAGAAAVLAGCASNTSSNDAAASDAVAENATEEASQEETDRAQDEPAPGAATEAAASAPLTCFDMHGDTVTRIAMQKYPPYDQELDRYTGDLECNNGELSADRMGAVRWAQCYAIWMPDEDEKISHIDWYHKSVKWFKKQMKMHADRFAQARSGSDVQKILEDGKVAAILTVENAACLDAGLEMVDEFAKDGVRIASLTWNGKNVLGCGNDNVDEGLTDLGRECIAALEERDIIVDVSHLNDKCFWEVDKIATKPYVATHSNARAVCNHSRNLDDDQFKAIVASGGLVGLNFNMDFVRNGGTLYTFEELAAHVEHWLSLDGGEDALALGSDRDGAITPSWLADCGMQSYLYARFEEAFGQSIADKLFYKNALRLFGVEEG